MQTLSTVAEFVQACKTLDRDEIYDLFEFEISDSVRDQIYAIATDPEDPEPVRAALNALGVQHNVRSLIEY